MSHLPKQEPAVPPLLYTPRAAGAALGCGESKINDLISSGRLAAIQFDGERRITHAALLAFVESLTQPQRRLRSVKR